jgi:hypothetical protein
MNKHPRLSLLAQVFVLLAIIEAVCAGFAFLSIKLGNGFLFYYSDIYQKAPDDYMAAENAAPPLGWLKDKDVSRDEPAVKGPICGAAFGDSFTVAEEVKPHEAWPYLLSIAMRCNVENFGAGGYGIDQSYLRYVLLDRHDPFVIIGLTTLMFKRDGAASYTYFAGQRDHHLPLIDVSKPLFVLSGDNLNLIPRPVAPVTRENLAAHDEYDFFKPFWTKLEFPYSFSVAEALYKKISKPRLSANILLGGSYWKPVLKVSYKILTEMDEAAQKRGAKLIIVIMPHPQDLVRGHAPYESTMNDIKAATKNSCLIDPYPALYQLGQKIGAENTHGPKGHYTPEGNEVIAEAIVKGMADCGITP